MGARRSPARDLGTVPSREVSALVYPHLDAIAASLGLPPSGPSLDFKHEGQPFTLSLDISSGGVHGWTLEVYDAALPAVRFSRESDFDRLGKQLHLNHEIQIGDERFDAYVYIDEGDRTPEEAVHALLRSSAVRRALTDTLALVTDVWTTPAGFHVRRRDDPRGTAFDPTVFAEILRNVQRFREALALQGPIRFVEKPIPQSSRWAGRVGVVAFLGLLVLGPSLMALTYPLVPAGAMFEALLTGGLAGLACFGVSVLGLVAWLRGRPGSLASILVAALILGFGVVPLGIGASWLLMYL